MFGMIPRRVKKLRKLVEEVTSEESPCIFDKTRGLCYNAYLDNLPRPFYWGMVSSWDEFSGDPTYPVKGKHRPSMSYYLAYNLYKGKYGRARLRLAQHCINYIKENKDVALRS